MSPQIQPTGICGNACVACSICPVFPYGVTGVISAN